MTLTDRAATRPTTLAQFMRDHRREIVSEWEAFALAHVSAASDMDPKARRDHIEGMLERIARDMATMETRGQRASKSKGLADAAASSASAANSHGSDRASTGFSPVDVVAEFRALRASVLRLWSEQQPGFTRENLEEVTRFNEAIDQLLVESMTKYGQDVDASKDLFLGVLGHDLRNPLGAIMMSATVMLTQEGPDWPHLKTASRILNAGTRMDGLISDLVDFTRTRLGSGIPISLAELDLETVCRRTIDEITAYHPHCVVHVTTSGALHGKWDAGRIGQLLSNLVGNAVQHGVSGVPIEVTLRGQADSVVLTVHNQGRRIPPEHLRVIFNPFRQLQPASGKARDGRSVGLGLYIVESIVKAHHGTIGVESTEHGTTFEMHLPRNPPEPPGEQAKAKHPGTA